MKREDEAKVYKYLCEWRTYRELCTHFKEIRSYWQYHITYWLDEGMIERGVKGKTYAFRWTEQAHELWKLHKGKVNVL